jgi:molybdopterin-synthase adenylyltransferase
VPAEDLYRYHRQMLLPAIGEEGQLRLRASHAVIVGCGALGCTIADLLARAGVGKLTLIDRDVVELTNLQRQTLFDESDAREGLPKSEAARRRLARVNSRIHVEAVIADFNSSNAERLLTSSPGPSVPPSLLLDGTDNFDTRYLLNDLAVKRNLPYLYAGVVGTHGLQATILPGRAACLRCLFPDPPVAGTQPTCDTAGVLGPAIAIAAACQATDAIKLLLGKEELLSGTLLEFDLWSNHRRSIDLGPPRPECPCCGERRFEFLDAVRPPLTSLCGQDAVQVLPPGETRLDLAGLRERLAPHGEFTVLGDLLLRGTLAHEVLDGRRIGLTLFTDGRAIIQGTIDPSRARAIYARYIGA